MIEIVEDGKNLRKIPPNPINRNFRCGICDCLFRFDQEGFHDSKPELIQIMEGRAFQRLAYSIVCPGSLHMIDQNQEGGVWAEHRTILETPID